VLPAPAISATGRHTRAAHAPLLEITRVVPVREEFSSSSPFTSTVDLPEEFLCPVSGTLMADPIIVSPGRTLERACIQAYAALAFYPPALADLPSSPLVLIPNVALCSAILNWCDRLGLPHPSPLSLDTAGDIVRRLMPPLLR
jgi:hypothetical protein